MNVYSMLGLIFKQNNNVNTFQSRFGHVDLFKLVTMLELHDNTCNHNMYDCDLTYRDLKIISDCVTSAAVSNILILKL